ncbi:MAG: acyl-CoA dehydrogenase family protein [Pseudomonadota bacterium]
MDFSFSQEQDILRDSARRFVEKECSIDYVKQFVDDKITFTGEMWRKISQLGWTAVLIPEEYGGLGLNFVDLAVILEEMGRGPVPGPFISSVVLAGEAIRLAGNPSQKDAYLPKMAMGELKGTLAWTEPGDLNGLANMTLTAKSAGSPLSSRAQKSLFRMRIRRTLSSVLLKVRKARACSWLRRENRELK